MPTFSRSALNPNGSFEADGMDASDQANFNMQNQRQQQSMMAQLALAQLRSGDARFAAERSDNMGMAGMNALSSINGQNIGHQDRMAEMQSRISDYLEFGVSYVWLINPRNRQAFIYTANHFEEVKDGILRTASPTLEVPLAELV